MDEWVEWAITAIVGGFFVLRGWLGLNMKQDIDRLKTEKANKDSTDARFASALAKLDRHMDEDRDMFKAVMQKMDLQTEQLQKTNISLATLIARVEANTRAQPDK